MCTVIISVPAHPGASLHVLAIRDEDPTRSWDPVGAWWPDTHPGVLGVRDARAGGAWLAADVAGGKLAVILNRAEITGVDPAEIGSRGHIVLDALAGHGMDAAPRVHGFNLVEVTADAATVTMWDGESIRRVPLGPGVHMIAHDDVDDAGTARIAHWHGAFATPPAEAERWWMPWLDTLDLSATQLAPTDDRAIIRDNRPFGYPTLSLLVCAASVSRSGVEVVYGELDRPGEWNRPELH